MRTGRLTTQQIEANMRILRRFVEVYCQKHHRSGATPAPCAECQDLLHYARRKLERCPYDPKPKCKDCPTHCYKKEYRQRVREVMRYSGIYFVKRGRLDWLVRYFLLDRQPRHRRRA